MNSDIDEANTKSKRERKKGDVKKLTKPVLVAKPQLTDKPTGKDKREMGPHQYATTLFNVEVNLISIGLWNIGRRRGIIIGTSVVDVA
jgi:hypothetical protein